MQFSDDSFFWFLRKIFTHTHTTWCTHSLNRFDAIENYSQKIDTKSEKIRKNPKKKNTRIGRLCLHAHESQKKPLRSKQAIDQDWTVRKIIYANTVPTEFVTEWGSECAHSLSLKTSSNHIHKIRIDECFEKNSFRIRYTHKPTDTNTPISARNVDAVWVLCLNIWMASTLFGKDCHAPNVLHICRRINFTTDTNEQWSIRRRVSVFSVSSVG